MFVESKEKPLLTKSGVIFEYRSVKHVPLVSLTKTKRHPRGSGRRQPFARMVTHHFSEGLIEPPHANEVAGGNSSSLEEDSDNVPHVDLTHSKGQTKTCLRARTKSEGSELRNVQHDEHHARQMSKSDDDAQGLSGISHGWWRSHHSGSKKF